MNAPAALSDAAVICAFMENKPARGPWSQRPWHSVSPAGWWVASEDRNVFTAPNEWFPIKLTFDRLWEVEERLTGNQWDRYWGHLRDGVYANGQPYLRGLIHATAADKIAALANVLRGTSTTCPATGAQPTKGEI